jgi:hypothetical protein
MFFGGICCRLQGFGNFHQLLDLARAKCRLSGSDYLGNFGIGYRLGLLGNPLVEPLRRAEKFGTAPPRIGNTAG